LPTETYCLLLREYLLRRNSVRWRVYELRRIYRNRLRDDPHWFDNFVRGYLLHRAMRLLLRLSHHDINFNEHHNHQRLHGTVQEEMEWHRVEHYVRQLQLTVLLQRGAV